MKIGYIGLGAMGGSLARHLVDDHDLVVYDLNPKSMALFQALGASVASTPRDLARICNIVILCLPRSSDVGALLFGDDGIAGDLTAGTLVIDQTSGSPALTIGFANRLAERGVLFMDAPVSGGIPAAQNRSVTIIASGPSAALELGKPVLDTMSTRAMHVGARVGDGQAIKLITNGIGAYYRLATLEIVALWRKFGLPLADIVSALNAGASANFTTRNMLMGLLEGRSTTNFSMALMVKDLNGVLELGALTGVPMPLMATARGLMQCTISLLGQDARLDDVIAMIEKLSAIEFNPKVADAATHLPTGLSAEDIAQRMVNAVAGLNTVAILEGVRVGQKFGLGVAEIARVIESGSAWSQVAGPLLSSVAAGTFRASEYSNQRQALQATADLAAQASTPFIMPNVGLSRLHDMQG